MALGYRAAIPSGPTHDDQGWTVPAGFSHKVFVGLIVIGLGLGACATRPADPEAAAEFDKMNDPAEPTNRAVFDFNNGFDRNVFKPVAQAYQDAVPGAVRRSVHNF